MSRLREAKYQLVLIVVCGLVVLTGCGQKGALYLPGPETAATAGSASGKPSRDKGEEPPIPLPESD